MPDHVYKIVIHVKLDENNNDRIKELNSFTKDCGFDEKILIRSHYTHAYVSSERELTPDEISILTRELNETYLASQRLRNIDHVEVIPATPQETADFHANEREHVSL